MSDTSALARGRSGTIVPIPADQSVEIYNIPSARRQDLIVQLGQALGADKIPAPFWACLQACDVGKLTEIVETASALPNIMWIVARYSCRYLPLLWLQKVGKDDNQSTSTFTSTSASAAADNRPLKRRRHREARPVQLAKKRDGEECIVRKQVPIQVAHIYFNYLIHPKSEQPRACSYQ